MCVRVGVRVCVRVGVVVFHAQSDQTPANKISHTL